MKKKRKSMALSGAIAEYMESLFSGSRSAKKHIKYHVLENVSQIINKFVLSRTAEMPADLPRKVL